MAAVTTSPPPASSIVTDRPHCRQTSRASRMRLMPPSRDSLSIAQSMAPAAWAANRASRSVSVSSRIIGRAVRRRIARHSAQRPAGLLEVDRLVLERGDELGGLVLAPVGVGVDDHHLLVPHHVEARAGAPHVALPVAAADLDLVAAEALREQLLGALPHRLRPVHPDDVVDGEARLEAFRRAGRSPGARSPGPGGPSRRCRSATSRRRGRTGRCPSARRPARSAAGPPRARPGP